MRDREPTFYSLHGKVAVVTGGAQAVGEGIVRRFAQAGAQVAIFDLRDEPARSVAHDVSGLAIHGDVTSESDIARAVDQVLTTWGSLDILVNNAAIVGKTAHIWELTRRNMEEVLEVNLVGPFLFCKAVIVGMVERGFGRIINVASIAGKEGNPTLIPYSASKAGLINLTKALAKEVIALSKNKGLRTGVTVNCISPAVIRTPMLESVPQATIDYMVSKIPMERTCEIDEVAALVHFLVSEESGFCTGQCYDISGGRATY
jgi:3-oxoacyl-[acyl-carrier protein] reductase